MGVLDHPPAEGRGNGQAPKSTCTVVEADAWACNGAQHCCALSYPYPSWHWSLLASMDALHAAPVSFRSNEYSCLPWQVRTVCPSTVVPLSVHLKFPDLSITSNWVFGGTTILVYGIFSTHPISCCSAENVGHALAVWQMGANCPPAGCWAAVPGEVGVGTGACAAG